MCVHNLKEKVTMWRHRSQADLYANELHKQWVIYFANWPPNRPFLSLGMYGKMQGNIFVGRQNIQERYGISVIPEAEVGTSSDIFECNSGGAVNLDVLVAGDADIAGHKLAHAGLSLTFNKDRAVYFLAAGITYKRIKNIDEVREAILEKMKSEEMDKHTRIVSEIVEADVATVIIAEGHEAGITLEADSPEIEVVNLANVKLKGHVRYGSQHRVGLRIVMNQIDGSEVAPKLSVLMGLEHLKGKYRGEIERGIAPPTIDMPEYKEYHIDKLDSEFELSIGRAQA